MRDTKLYDSKKKAISSMRKKNDNWMSLNYDDQFINDSGFEYGAIDVGAGKYKFKKGKEEFEDEISRAQEDVTTTDDTDKRS